MTKITTDFVGTESTVVTKSRLTQILAYWGASTAGYTTWGQARTDLNYRLLNTTAGVIGNEELAGSFLPKINFLNDPDSMVLTALFGAGEQGVWFDPSDVANIDWRRNLLLWTEAFDNPIWFKTRLSVSPNTATAPDATLTADKLVEDTATNTHQMYAGNGIVGATFSIYAKAAERSILGVYSGAWFSFNLSSGVATGAGATMVNAGNGWWRCIAPRTNSTDVFLGPSINTVTNDVTWGYTGNGTSGVLIWGAQLELGSTATEYQPITTLNAEVIARFPDATMYQDFSGTASVYAPNQPVGLRLDKSKGGRQTLPTTGWSKNSGDGVVTIVDNVITITGATTTTRVDVNSPGWDVGNHAIITVNASIGSAVDPFMYIGGTLFAISSGVGAYSVVVSSNTLLRLQVTSGSATFTVTARSRTPGNHATQSTDISRPLYGIEPAGGRRNLLTFSEQFDNPIWVKGSGTSVTANTHTAPNGTVTADTVTTTTGLELTVLNIPIVSGVSYTASISVRKTSGATVFPLMSFSIGATAEVILNTNTGVLSVRSGSPGATDLNVVDQGDYWRLSFSRVSAGTSANLFFYPAASTNGTSYTGGLSGSQVIWGAQLELNTAATPYQKVVSAYEVTEAGVQTCHYCNYDGTNDGMITNSIDFTATDKISTFAVIRSTSAGAQVVAELSASSSANAGSFLIGSGSFVSGGNRMGGQLAGSTVLGYDSPANFPQPSFLLVSNLYNIAGTTALAEAGLRINTVVQSPINAGAAGSAGTGNFGNYRLNLGRRGNDQVTPTLPFNGRDYGIIVTGKLATSTQIGNAESFLLNKLGSLAPVITGVPTIGVN